MGFVFRSDEKKGWPLPLQRAFGRTAEPWLDFDPARTRAAVGRAAAATANPLASWAALTVLRAGGCAVDAAVATQAVLTLVEPNASGVGGGAVMLVHDGGAVRCYDGLSTAPARAPTRLLTDFDGRTVPADRAIYGGRTVGVPGALRALEVAHRRHGRLSWAELFDPAIELAEDGFPLAPYLWRTLQENPAMRDEPMAGALYCGGGSGTLLPGSTLRNAALARTLRRVADGGADAFYGGEIAAAICQVVRADPFPGTITLADMAEYRAVERTPLHFPLGAMSVVTGALPCYGGIAAGQITGVLAAFGVTGLGHALTLEETHLLSEAGRVAFADRAPYADPDHHPMDAAALLDPGYLAERARLIDRHRRADRIKVRAASGASQTSHVCIADGDGQVVSMTTTLNQNFGARISVGGFYLNNVMTNFATDRPEKNHPNAIAPGKRARTTIGPSIVLGADGRPVAAIGAGGGYRIIGYLANGLLRLAGGERDPQAIVAAPHALNWSGVTEIEPELRLHTAELVARGHWVTMRRLDGGTQCVVRDDAGWRAAGDPRRDGAGMALSNGF